MIQDADGIAAVRTARSAAEAEVHRKGAKYPKDGIFGTESGAFVTYRTYPDKGLRGCIGFPAPILPLGEAISQAAISACHDPRFPDLAPAELDHITVEVTILTVPHRIDCPKEELPSKIVIGRDGLILTCGRWRGLLLPQVPVEWGWDTIEYLENLSLKAGLQPDAWKRSDAVIEAFEGEIFAETEPNGEIRRE